MAKTSWKVGELARLTGVSVRTLHHYHDIGLLRPSARSESGYRLYDADDVARLQQIKSLRSLGFSLEDVRLCLERNVFSANQIVEMHLAQLREKIRLQQQLCTRLEAVQTQMSTRQETSVEEFLKIIEVMNMTEKYFDNEQMSYLEERRKAVGEERIREVEAEWPRLMDEVRTAIERGESPDSPHAQELAKRWNSLVEEFTGGNQGIRDSLNTMYQSEDNVAGMDIKAMQPLYEFIQRAMEVST